MGFNEITPDDHAIIIGTTFPVSVALLTEVIMTVVAKMHDIRSILLIKKNEAVPLMPKWNGVNGINDSSLLQFRPTSLM
jgi:hypothetical protein